MTEEMKLTEKDFNDLLDSVKLWGDETPDTNDATAEILANVFSSEDKNELKKLVIEKRKEFEQNKKQRQRDAALLSAKLIMIQRAFMDSPSAFDLNEHLK